jgi:hypothetical protein
LPRLSVLGNVAQLFHHGSDANGRFVKFLNRYRAGSSLAGGEKPLRGLRDEEPIGAEKPVMMTLPLRFLLIVVGSVACLALAVLGWGRVAAFFSHPALVALTVEFFVLVGVAFFAGGNVSPGVRGD